MNAWFIVWFRSPDDEVGLVLDRGFASLRECTVAAEILRDNFPRELFIPDDLVDRFEYEIVGDETNAVVVVRKKLPKLRLVLGMKKP